MLTSVAALQINGKQRIFAIAMVRASGGRQPLVVYPAARNDFERTTSISAGELPAERKYERYPKFTVVDRRKFRKMTKPALRQPRPRLQSRKPLRRLLRGSPG